MHHRTAYDGEFGKSAAAAVVAVQCDHGTVVVLSGVAPEAMATGLERFYRHQISGRQILDAGTEGHDHARQFMTEYDGVFDPGERMRCGAGGQRPVVVLVQVAAANSVLNDTQLDIAGARFGLGNRFEPKVPGTVKNRSTHSISEGIAVWLAVGAA